MDAPPDRKTALAEMTGGGWYAALSPVYETMRQEARRACHQHNTMGPDARGPCGPLLRGLFAGFGRAFLEAPFHCSYGVNLSLGDGAYMNAGCVVLDNAPVTIGDGTMLGPGVNIYCADHHRDPVRRRAGVERTLPVTLGRDVWIGGGAIILPGVTIGDGAIVAAGAVVSRDVPPGGQVAGVPARQMPSGLPG